MIVFEVVIDTMFLCFLVDLEHNGEVSAAVAHAWPAVWSH